MSIRLWLWWLLWLWSGVNSNAVIDFLEFLSLTVCMMKDIETAEELVEACKMFDRDGTSFIIATAWYHQRNYRNTAAS